MILRILALIVLCASSLCAQNPTIFINQLFPDHAIAGTTSVTVQINGVNFSSFSIASWDGVDLSTTFVNSKIITAVIPSGDLNAIGTHKITVHSLSEITSDPKPFRVLSPITPIDSYTPTLFVVGQDTAIDVLGQDFVSNATILFDFQPITTTFVSTGELQGTIPGSLILAGITHQVQVYSGAFPGGSVTYVQPPQFNVGTVSISAPDLNSLNGGVIRDTLGNVTLGTPWFTITAVSSGATFTMNPGSCSDALMMTPGAECSFTIDGIASTPGTKTATLSVYSDALNSPQILVLSLSASSALTMAVAPLSLNFGSVATGGGTTSLTVDVTATFGSFTLSTPYKTLTGSGDFSVSGTCSDGGAVPCSPTVTFTPSSGGAKSGSLAINSGADNSPIAIALSGTGVTPSTHHVLLNWGASTSTVVGYNLYRAIAGNSFSGTPLNGGTPINALTYTDTTVTPGTTYVYGLAAVGGSGFSWPAGTLSTMIISNTVTP